MPVWERKQERKREGLMNADEAGPAADMCRGEERGGIC